MITWLATHGAALLAGATIVLGLGALATACHRGRPLHRKRLGELTLLAALAWLAGAWMPLPRWELPLGETPTRPVTQAQLTANSRPAPGPLERSTTSRGAALAGPTGLAAQRTSAVPTTRTPRGPDTAPPRSAGIREGADPLAAPDGPAPQRVTPSWLAIHGPELVALVFVAGASACLLWLLLGWLRLRRMLARSEPAPARLAALLAELDADDLRLRVLPGRTGPFCVGLRRPTIVMPAALVREGDRRTLTHVLAHEIAHARHGDGLGRLICAVALPAFWCHPLFWWLRRDLRLSAELLADDRAARLSGPRHYARDLLSLASTTLASGRVPAGAPSIFGTPSEFTRRIDMLLQRHGPLATRLSPARQALQGLAAITVTAGALMLFGATPAAAQDVDAQATLLRAAESAAEAEQLRAQNQVLETRLAEMAQLLQQFEERFAALQDERNADAVEVRELAASQAAAERERALLAQVAGGGPGAAGLREMLSLQNQADAERAAAQRAQVGAASDEDLRSLSALGYIGNGTTGGGGQGGFTAPQATTDRPSDAAPASVIDGALLDVIDRALQARADLETLAGELTHQAPLADQGLVSQRDLRALEIQLETQRRRLDVMHLLIDGELGATEIELSRVSAREPLDVARMKRLEARMQVLRSVR